MQIDDIHVDDFVRVLQKLESHLPISDQYELVRPQLRGVWWSSQQLHMVTWFGNQESLGSGAFSEYQRETDLQQASRTSCVRMDGRGAGRGARRRAGRS